MDTSNNILAPIVLFSYNRLECTRKTIEALQRNLLAKESDIYIYSDAPKNESDEKSVTSVREYLRGVTGFKKINIIERQENWGLANNIIDGVTKIASEYGKIIVLEDDIVTSKYFLKYMNDALNIYKDNYQVQLVSGYVFLENNIHRDAAYFLPCTSCWGWGTWNRVWRDFKRDPDELMKKYTDEKIKKFNLDGAYDFWSQVQQNADGRIFTWAIFLYELVFRKNGVCLYPPIALTTNIGCDNTGTHCGKEDEQNIIRIKEEYEITKFPTNIVIDEKLFAKVKTRLRKIKPGLLKKMFYKIRMFVKI